MNLQPQIHQRGAQPYAGIRTSVTMADFPQAADTCFPELFGWRQEHGITPAGPPLIRYHVIKMEAELDIEFGVPVSTTVPESGRVHAGVLPPGRYVTLRHIGPYDGLVESNTALLRWASDQGIALDRWDTERGEAWRGRVEHYFTDPAAEPDPAKWEVEVAFLASES
jgi:effector-binding domain-containing protein